MRRMDDAGLKRNVEAYWGIPGTLVQKAVCGKDGQEMADELRCTLSLREGGFLLVPLSHLDMFRSQQKIGDH